MWPTKLGLGDNKTGHPAATFSSAEPGIANSPAIYVSGEALKLYRNIARQYAYLYQRIQQVSGLKNLILSQAFTV